METQPTRPRFRTDLVAKPVEEQGQVFVDVTDPDTGSTFRFYEVEYSVACAMDGARDLDALAAWAHKELGLEPSREELSTVVATLGELGYLDRNAAAGRKTRAPSQAPTTKNPALARTLAAPTSLDPEESFAGLLDDDETKTRPAARMPRRNMRPDSEEDTQIPPPRSPVADDDGPRLSTDLSEHVPIDADDVKDAVRHSRVHVAVVPPITPAKPAPAKPTPAQPTPAAPAPVTPAPATPTPVPLSSAGVAPRATPAVTTADDKGGGGLLTALVVVLFIVALGLVGVYYYLNYMKGAEEEPAAGAETPPTTPAPADELPAAPPTTTLSQAQPVPVPVVAEIEGKVAWVAEDATVLAAGDAVLRLEGAEQAAKELAHYKQRLKHYSDMLDRATAEGNKSRMARAERKVEQKHQLIAESETKLAALTVKAPAAGEIKPKVAAGDEIKKGDQVAALVGEPGTRGTFTVEPGAFYEEGGQVTVTSASDPAKKAQCEVAAVVSNAVTVRCPAGSGFSPGDQVTLQ